MKLVSFAASVRPGSLNQRLLETLIARLVVAGCSVNTLDYRRFYDMPHYATEEETGNGIPKEAREISDQIADADGVVIATPEFNFAMPGHLKNGLDWISRIKPSGFVGKPVLLAAASMSPVGGVRGLQALRPTLDCLGAISLPYIVSVGGVVDADALSQSVAAGPLSDRIEIAQQAFLKSLGN